MRQAEAFYERVLIGYGDNSVAELGGAHVACEGVSNIAAKALEDARLGISPLEKSTRYVVFNRKLAGRYRYLRESAIMASRHAARYEQALDHLFDTYSLLLEPTGIAAVRAHTPRDARPPSGPIAAPRAPRPAICCAAPPNGHAHECRAVRQWPRLRVPAHAPVCVATGRAAHAGTGAVRFQHALNALIPSFVKRADDSTRARPSRPTCAGQIASGCMRCWKIAGAG